MDEIDYYDMIIDIYSMKSLLNDGWEIETSSKGQNKIKEKKDIPSILISVIGNHNTGKSFILNQISETCVPAGYSLPTKGLSFKYLDNKNIILLDSLGFNQSLVENDVYRLSNRRSELEEKQFLDEVSVFANDRFLTEYFILNFILYYSNIPILVLEELSFPEQELYNKAKKLLYGNQLFVIHNLKTYGAIEQVKDFIKDNLENSITFNLKKNKIIELGEEKLNNKNNIYYFEEIINNEHEKKYIIHLIMAKDGTEAGDYYNQTTINYLKQIINTYYITQKFPIEQKIKEFLFKISNNIMEDPIYDINQIIIEKNYIKLSTEKDIEFKRINYDDITLSEPLIGRRYKPKCDYYKSEDGKNLFIELIINGIVEGFKVKVSLSNNNYIFSFSGKKNIHFDNESDKKFEGISKRGEGYFSFELKIPTSEIELASYQVSDKKIQYGIITLVYELVDNNNNLFESNF